MRPHLGIAGMSHVLILLPLTENLDLLSMAHLALSRIPPLRSEMCKSPTSAMWPFPLPKLPLSAEVSNPPDEQLSSKTGKKQSWSVMLEACPGECWLVTNEETPRRGVMRYGYSTLPDKGGLVAWVQLA